jgi:hypothetical protein
MRKLVLSLAALASFALVLPYAAPAKAEVMIMHHHHHHHHDHGKTVVIKHD